MKNLNFKGLAMAVAASAISFGSYAQNISNKLPESKEVLKQINKVNDYFMTKYADFTATSTVRGVTRPSNIWTRGVYYEGLMALYEISPEERFYKYAYDWADFHKWGFRSTNTTRNADNYCAAQTYIDLYILQPESFKLRNTLANQQMLLKTPQVGDWTWIDAIQMGMPVMAKLGKLYNDERYFRKMRQMYDAPRNVIGGGLFNLKEGLWWRDADFVPPYKEPNGANCYWSRGNGWVVAALCRIMNELPVSHKDFNYYLKDYKMMIEALVKCQRKDCFWNVSLHDESNYGGIEVTGTALFIYGMAWGVNNGYLPKEEFLPIIAQTWNAIYARCVHPDNGFLGYVQGTGKEPKDGQPVTYDSMPDFEDYGIGCYLLCGAEVYKLAAAEYGK